MSGPALGLISQAIRLWLKSVCSRLDQLELKLEGSLLQLMRGRLEGVRVEARGVVFQGLALEQVALRSEPISIDVAPLLKGQPLQLRQSFAVKGWVRFSEAGLNQCLQSPGLQDLNAALGNTFLAGASLQHFGLGNTGVNLRDHNGLQQACCLQLQNGELRLQQQERRLVIPMDPAIRLEQLEQDQTQLKLSGCAQVSPEPVG
jgi:hypothetical protein